MRESSGMDEYYRVLGETGDAVRSTTEYATILQIQLLKIRQMLLAARLNERGFGVCQDQDHSFLLSEKPTDEELGIVKRADLFIWYQTTLPTMHRSELSDMIGQAFPEVVRLIRRETLGFLCPPHAIGLEDRHFTFATDGEANFESRVLDEGERYTTRIHQLDVTPQVTHALNSRTYPEPVYSHLSILPQNS